MSLRSEMTGDYACSEAPSLICAAQHPQQAQQSDVADVIGLHDLPVRENIESLRDEIGYRLALSEQDNRMLASELILCLNMRVRALLGLTEGITALVEYVPRRKFWYLDQRFAHRVEMLVRHETEHGTLTAELAELLTHAAEALRVAGKRRVGDVIQMSIDEIKKLTGASDDLIKVLNADLARFDLRLGMKVVGWSPAPLPQWVHI